MSVVQVVEDFPFPASSVMSTGIFVDGDGVWSQGVRFASVDDAYVFVQRRAMQVQAMSTVLELEASIEMLQGLREVALAEVAGHAEQIGVLRDKATPPRGMSECGAVIETGEAVGVLAVASRRSERAVQRQLAVAAGRAAELPATLRAWGDGGVQSGHVRVIERAANIIDTADRPAFDAEILPYARGRTPAQLAPIARRIAKTFTAKPLRVRHAEAFAERGTWVTPGDDGMATFSILTSAVLAEGISNRLRLAYKHQSADDARSLPQFAADTATAVLLAGDIPEPDAAAGSGGAAGFGCGWLRGITAHVTVTMPATALTWAEQGRAELPDGQLVDDGTALLLAGGVASVTRLFTDPVTQVAITADTYQLPASLRRAVIGRDQHCRFPGCTRPAGQSDIDHTRAWEHGGTSRYDNLAGLCRKHHVRKHRLGPDHGWRVTQPSPGVLAWTDPTGRHITVTPEPNPTAVDIEAARRANAHPRAGDAATSNPDPPTETWHSQDHWHEEPPPDDAAADPPPDDPTAHPPPF